jgi:hypothetical protein
MARCDEVWAAVYESIHTWYRGLIVALHANEKNDYVMPPCRLIHDSHSRLKTVKNGHSLVMHGGNLEIYANPG